MLINDDLRTLLADTVPRCLPVPRLHLVWGPETNNGVRYESVCHYLIVFRVDQYDIRNLGTEWNPYTAAELGRTRCEGGKSYWDRELETPYREGAHAKWDSKTFGGLSVFVSRGSECKRVEV